MTEDEKEAIQYRFSGYQLPMIQLDSTGDQYVHMTAASGFPHPYYINQPEVWQEPAYHGRIPILDSVTTADFLYPLSLTDGMDYFNDV